MQTYYQILGVEEDASLPQIKRAFREKAKSIHPDTAARGADTGDAGVLMGELVRIYETLVNPSLREEYDRTRARHVSKKDEFDYRSWLLKRHDDPASMAKLVFFDLLHLREEEAIARWQELGGLNFPLDAYLDREDWMDCSFILAEELDRLGDPWAACRLLLSIIAEEERKPYFRHFFPEVVGLLREIARERLLGRVDDELAIDCLEDLVQLAIPAKEKARYWRSMGDALDRIGDRKEANRAWSMAMTLDSSLKLARDKMRRVMGEQF